jgi:hypothetical protein
MSDRTDESREHFFRINELPQILKIIGQCDIRYIMMLILKKCSRDSSVLSDMTSKICADSRDSSVLSDMTSKICADLLSIDTRLVFCKVGQVTLETIIPRIIACPTGISHSTFRTVNILHTTYKNNVYL